MAVFAAGPDAFVEREVVSDSRDAFEYVRAVADQSRALHGASDLPILNPVGPLALKTNLPLVMSTWPPPNETA